MTPPRARAIVVDGKVVGIACARGRAVRCSTAGCTNSADLLCDWPVTRKGRVGTCDRRVCSRCALARAPGVDYCAAHAREFQRQGGE